MVFKTLSLGLALGNVSVENDVPGTSTDNFQDTAGLVADLSHLPPEASPPGVGELDKEVFVQNPTLQIPRFAAPAFLQPPDLRVEGSGLGASFFFLSGIKNLRTWFQRQTNPFAYLRSVLDDQNLASTDRVKLAVSFLREKGAAPDNKYGVILYLLHQVVLNPLMISEILNERIGETPDTSHFSELSDLFPDMESWSSDPRLTSAYAHFLMSDEAKEWTRCGLYSEDKIPLSQFLFYRYAQWPDSLVNFLRNRNQCSVEEESRAWENLGDTKRAFMALMRDFDSLADAGKKSQRLQRIASLWTDDMGSFYRDYGQKMSPEVLGYFYLLNENEKKEFFRGMIKYAHLCRSPEDIYGWTAQIFNYYRLGNEAEVVKILLEEIKSLNSYQQSDGGYGDQITKYQKNIAVLLIRTILTAKEKNREEIKNTIEIESDSHRLPFNDLIKAVVQGDFILACDLACKKHVANLILNHDGSSLIITIIERALSIVESEKDCDTLRNVIAHCGPFLSSFSRSLVIMNFVLFARAIKFNFLSVYWHDSLRDILHHNRESLDFDFFLLHAGNIFPEFYEIVADVLEESLPEQQKFLSQGRASYLQPLRTIIKIREFFYHRPRFDDVFLKRFIGLEILFRTSWAEARIEAIKSNRDFNDTNRSAAFLALLREDDFRGDGISYSVAYVLILNELKDHFKRFPSLNNQIEKNISAKMQQWYDWVVLFGISEPLLGIPEKWKNKFADYFSARQSQDTWH